MINFIIRNKGGRFMFRSPYLLLTVDIAMYSYSTTCFYIYYHFVF
jgi:hypothetical protein